MRETATARLQQISEARKVGHTYFAARSAVYRKFLELEAVAFADGALSRREKELIAVGISIANSCEPCLEWHVRQALRAGADEAQVVEAVGVAMEMGVGPTTVTSRFAVTVLDDELRGPHPAE